MAKPTTKPSKPLPKKKVAAQPGATAPKRGRKPRRVDDSPTVASPAAAGPAGALLEGHVGAQYLLPLLSGGEARGLPGVVVTRVSFQGAGLGHPMDDVIVSGHDNQGRSATLEVQAKRKIAFTASDKVFQDVVALACRAAAKPEFESTRYELAVAISRTSTKIEQHVHEVLKWARDYQGADGFFGRLNQHGAAHQEMREFVTAFRDHMRTAGAVPDDVAVHRLLSRFQVLAFDFEQPGSVCAQLARDRCALQLAPQDVGRAGELWDTLQQIALEVDSKGGNLDAGLLRERLVSERGYRLAGDKRLYVARERLHESAESTLATIRTTVRDVAIDRSDRTGAALIALDQGRYLEIRGAGGVGKSGVLKDLAQRVSVESRIIVVAPHRVPGGGWLALAAQLGCDVTAREFLTDLAGDGGGMLFIDGIDRVDDPGQRATVVDLIRAAAQVKGFRVVVTTRLDFDADARAWLPAQALKDLGEAPPLVIDELGDAEVAQLRDADPALAALLTSGHPAEKLVRNLYRLDRLSRSQAVDDSATFGEAQMAWQWWSTGDAAEVAGLLERRRVLRSLAAHSLATSAPMDAGALPADAITALAKSGSLMCRSSVHIEPAHDVLRDWSIGCLLYEEPQFFEALALETPALVRLVRGVELAARLHAERGSDETGWRTLVERVSVSGAHSSWRRSVLLALARTECAGEVLSRCLPALAKGNAELLAELVRAAVTVDSQPAVPFWAVLGADTSKLTDDFVAPRGPTWLNLIAWSLIVGDRLPLAAVPQFVDLYSRFSNAFMGLDALSPLLVARLYTWLVEVEVKNHPNASSFTEWMAVKDAPGLSMTSSQESDLRNAFLMWCKLRPAEAEAYLQWVTKHPRRHVLFRQLLTFVGSAPYAAPQALADLFLQALPEGDDDEDDRGVRMRDVFTAWDSEYFPASPARAPFFDLLQANKVQGLRLVRGVVAHAIKRRSRRHEPGNNYIEVPLPAGQRSFPWCQSYMWSRSQGSNIVASALMALEAWAHTRIERGDPIGEVLDDVLGPEGSPAAYLLVAVDIMLSHWPKTREILWPFAASAELLAMDRQRFANDIMNANGISTTWVRPEPAKIARLDDLLRRPSRRMPLDVVLKDYGSQGPTGVREAMKEALRRDADRIGPPDNQSRGMADPRFAAMSALNQLDPANYITRGADESGRTIAEYVPPADELRLLTDRQQEAQRGSDEVAIRVQLMQALSQARCPEQLLEQGVRWATRDASVSQVDSDIDGQEWIERTRFIVAALLMRDGSKDMKAGHRDWAKARLAEATARKPDSIGIVKQLSYNPAAIAAVGYLAAYRENNEHADLAHLLHLAARRDTGMVSVLRAELAAQRPLSPELTRSLVRLGLAAAVYAVPQPDGDDFVCIEDYRARHQALEKARNEAEQMWLQSAVAAELDWLSAGGREPDWPKLPEPSPYKKRRGISLDKAREQQARAALPASVLALDAREAAKWFPLAVDLWRAARPDLLCTLVLHYWPWTAGSNGVGCEPDEEPAEPAYEWNDAYFAAALAAGVSIGDAGIKEYVLAPLAQLPEERFLDASEAVLQALDQLWLGDGVVSNSTAVTLREAIAEQLSATQAWHYVASERSVGVEIHVAGTIAAMFMGQHDMGRGPRCYVLPPGVSRADLLLPMLTQLVEQAAGSTFVAMAFLGLLEVQPHANQLTFMTRAVNEWWRAQGANAEFWIDYGVGRRLCAWIDKAVLDASASPAALHSSELTAIVDILLQCGTPLARGLEERLAARRKLVDG